MHLFVNLFLFYVEAVIVSNYMAYCNYDDLENFICPEDVESLSKIQLTDLGNSSESTPTIFSRVLDVSNDTQDESKQADCFGITTKLSWMFNLKPQNVEDIQPGYFFHNRKLSTVAQVMTGDRFNLSGTFYDAKKPTIVIVHGFLSYSKAAWIVNMTIAFLEWRDVNVITVDWSKGGNTWKYWRAVANTRTVGADLAGFLKQLMNETGAQTKDFHFVGHSLGAHICSYAAALLGGVRRITGLDPAQPCFETTDLNMLLDKSDADFVDIIHTNGRDVTKMGFGNPTPFGNQDFYPNGGMKQPGCYTGKLNTIKAKLMRAICNHGRAYLLFTESLKRHNCSMLGHRWNTSYNSVNASLQDACSSRTCAVMGIQADRYPARGPFYVVTTSEEPYCEVKPRNVEVREFLLDELRQKSVNTLQAFATTPPTIKRGFFSFLGR